MKDRVWYLTLMALAASATGALGQATLNPAYNAPYRAFADKEYGLAISIPGGTDAAFEGVYRVGSGRFDVGFRGGVAVGVGPSDETLLIFGTEFRNRIITHNEEFPADGAIVFGAGARLGEFNQLVLPVGLSLGRRLDVEDSDVSIVPYLQPTLIVIAGDGEDVIFSMGFGADFRLTRVFDLRVSVGLGDLDGISVGAVWVR